MNLKKKLFFAGGILGGVLAAFAGGTWIYRILSGHDEPLTIDNPRASIGFGYWGHKVVVDHNPQTKRVHLTRDITSISSIWAYPRNPPDGEKYEVQADFSHPIEIYTSAGDPITITAQSKKHSGEHNRVVIVADEAFRYCSPALNACSSTNAQLRLSSIRYRDRRGVARHYCLNAWEDLTSGARCTQTNDKRTRVELIMLGE